MLRRLMMAALVAVPLLKPSEAQSSLSNSATDYVPLTVTGMAGTTVDLFRVYDDTSLVMYLDSSGQTFVSGGSVGTASDRRLKHNFKGIDDPLDKVLRMRGVEYNFNETLMPNSGGARDIGFIAQEVLEVEPMLVQKPSSGDMSEYFHVEYAKVAPLLVEALKEMHDRFNEQKVVLQARVAALAGHDAAETAQQWAEIAELRGMIEQLVAKRKRRRLRGNI